MTIQEQKEFVQFRQDHTLRLRFSDLPLERFWLMTSKEFPLTANKAILTLLPFSTTYLCEMSFAIMTAIKVKKRERLRTVLKEV